MAPLGHGLKQQSRMSKLQGSVVGQARFWNRPNMVLSHCLELVAFAGAQFTIV